MTDTSTPRTTAVMDEIVHAANPQWEHLELLSATLERELAAQVQIAAGLATELEEERRAREDSDERIRLYIEEAVAADKRAAIAESALAKCSDWTKMSVSELAEGNPSLKAYSDNLEYELLKLRAAK